MYVILSELWPNAVCFGLLQVFHDIAYKAKDRGDLLAGIDEFLDEVIVLPPGEWDPDIRIEPPKSIPSSDKRYQQPHGPASYLLNQIQYLFLIHFGLLIPKIVSVLPQSCHSFSQNMMHFVAFLLLTTIHKVKKNLVLSFNQQKHSHKHVIPVWTWARLQPVSQVSWFSHVWMTLKTLFFT